MYFCLLIFLRIEKYSFKKVVFFQIMERKLNDFLHEKKQICQILQAHKNFSILKKGTKKIHGKNQIFQKF